MKILNSYCKILIIGVVSLTSCSIIHLNSYNQRKLNPSLDKISSDIAFKTITREEGRKYYNQSEINLKLYFIALKKNEVEFVKVENRGNLDSIIVNQICDEILKNKKFESLLILESKNYYVEYDEPPVAVTPMTVLIRQLNRREIFKVKNGI